MLPFSAYGPNTGLNYASWMLFGVPTMLVATLGVAGIMLLYTVDWRALYLRSYNCI